MCYKSQSLIATSKLPYFLQNDNDLIFKEFLFFALILASKFQCIVSIGAECTCKLFATMKANRTEEVHGLHCSPEQYFSYEKFLTYRRILTHSNICSIYPRYLNRRSLKSNSGHYILINNLEIAKFT